MSSTYKEIGERIGALVDEKNAAYGSSFAASGAFLKLLYPNGLQPEQYAYALLLVRIFDKQMRIATDADARGESPFQDIAGYGLLGSLLQEETKKRCGSASETGAVEESMEQNGSAGQPAPRPITTSAEPQTVWPSTPPFSPQHFNCSCVPVAPAAESDSPRRGEDLVEAVRVSNRVVKCGMCPNAMKPEWVSGAWAGEYFYFCSRECRANFHRGVQVGWPR